MLHRGLLTGYLAEQKPSTMKRALFDVVNVATRKWVLIMKVMASTPRNHPFGLLRDSNGRAEAKMTATCIYYNNTWWDALSSLGCILDFEAHIIISMTVSGGTSLAVICYQTACFQSLLCLDTNQVVAALWWAFVISCHDWIQMALGCILSWLWQLSEVLDDGGSQWGVTTTQKVAQATSAAHDTSWTATGYLSYHRAASQPVNVFGAFRSLDA